MADALDSFLGSQKSGDALDDFLGKQGGLTPERKAALEKRHQQYQSEIASLKAEQNAPDNNPYAAGIRGGAAGLSDIADKATLGGYKKLRDAALAKLSPDTLSKIQQSEKEFHEPIEGNRGMRALQVGTNVGNALAGYGTGLGGAAGRFGGALVGANTAGKIIPSAVGGAIGGGITGAGQSAIAGDKIGDIAKSAGIGALGGGVAGAAIGGLGKLIKGAPARVAGQEIEGLTDVRTSSALRKYEPHAEDINHELNTAPQIRKLVRADPTRALPLVKQRLKSAAEDELNPIYSELTRSGKDQIPVEHAVNNLKAVAAGFNKYAEAPQIAVINNLAESLQNDAMANGGKLPADLLRKTATAYQAQGHANLPMLGPISLTKEAKQGIGNALRASIGDHLESLADNTESGKALRQIFQDANKRVSTWYQIHDLVDERARYEAAHKVPMARVIQKGLHLMHGGVLGLLPFAEPAGQAIDRGVLAPLAKRGAANAVQSTLPTAANASGDILNEALRKKRQQDADAVNNLIGP